MNGVYLIILAAGAGSRFGGPKALAKWQEGTLLSHVVSLAPKDANLMVITGAHRDLLLPHLNNMKESYNPNWAIGMGSSIATGLKMAQADGAELALIMPVDQPFVTQDHLEKLIVLAQAEGKCALTQDGDIIGPPAAVPARFFSEFTKLEASGLKKALNDYAVCAGTGMLRDIDTLDDLARYTS